MKINERKHSLFQSRGTALQVLLYAIVAAFSIALGRLMPDIGLVGGATALLLGAAVVIGGMMAVSWTKERQFDAALDRAIQEVRGQLVTVLESYRLQTEGVIGSHVMNTTAIVAFEESCGASEVVIVTMSMERDRPGEPIFDVVLRNTEKGVKYVYVTVVGAESDAKIDDIIKYLGSRSEWVRFVTVPRDRLEAVTETNIVLYRFEETESIVMVELAVQADPDQRVWVRLHRDFSYKVAGRVNRLIESHGLESVDKKL